MTIEGFGTFSVADATARAKGKIDWINIPDKAGKIKKVVRFKADSHLGGKTPTEEDMEYFLD